MMPSNSSCLLFVSANTNDDSTLQDILSAESKAQESRLESFCRAHLLPHVSGSSLASGVGFWEDGEERTTVLRTEEAHDLEYLQYIASLVGLKFEQRAVLVFRSHALESSRLHILRKETMLVAAQRVMKSLSIDEWTYIAASNGATLYLYEEPSTKGVHARQLSRIQTEYGFQVETLTGDGIYVGLSDRRAEAAIKYRDIIAAFERRRPGDVLPVRIRM